MKCNVYIYVAVALFYFKSPYFDLIFPNEMVNCT